MPNRIVLAVTGYWLPGALLMIVAFWAGAQKDPTMGMLGFVPFFMMASFLFIYGWKKIKGEEKNNGTGGDT